MSYKGGFLKSDFIHFILLDLMTSQWLLLKEMGLAALLWDEEIIINGN